MKNVILLTLDATRKDVFGVYGNKSGLTPTFDSLRNESLIFTRGQTIGPYTQASFTGILTSSYYLDYWLPGKLAPERTIISEPLHEAGIVTVAFHSNPYLFGFTGWDRGWDIYYDSSEDEVDPKLCYIKGDVINQKAIKWLSSHCQSQGARPFFIWLHYMDVHEPYMPEKKYIDMVDASINIREDEMDSLFCNVLLKRDVTDPGKVQLLRKLYDMQVREVDTYFEEFLSSLKKLGVLEDAIIIITNDHGDEFNEHGGLSHDDKMYSELIDMPLIIYGTGKSGFCDTVVSNLDIPPTIIQLLGLNPVEKFQGHSLLPIEDYPNKGVFGEAVHHEIGKGGDINRDVYFCREQDLKVIYRADLNMWEMYNLASDPKELSNIINVSPEAERLKNKLRPRVRRLNASK